MTNRLISTANRSRSLAPAFWALCLFLSASLSFAHPMGNFSTSHYSGIRVQRKFVEIRYLIDMAEIPAFQEIQENNLVAKTDDATARAYLHRQAESFRTKLTLTLNGQPLILRTESADVIFPSGAGGLPTMKMSFLYRASIVPASNKTGEAIESNLYYRDDNFQNRAGWKEVVATAGQGVTIVSANVPANDRSAELSNYPTDLLNGPPLNLEASVSLRWEPMAADDPAMNAAAANPGDLGRNRGAPTTHQTLTASAPTKAQPEAEVQTESLNKENSFFASGEAVPAVPLQANKQSTPQNRFTELMTTKTFSVWFLFVAAAIAAGLGAMHALEPGHGKTIVAAYLVGSKGTAYHALLLGLIVTVSHTASVYALGAVTLYASKYIVPEQLYPWLGAISGLLIAAVGSYLFLQRYVGNEIGHSHGPGHHHHGFGHSHDHANGLVHSHDGSDLNLEHSHDGMTVIGENQIDLKEDARRNVPYRQLLALGITGGIIPCPAALVVLLSAVALNRVGFGLFLIVAFSVGLAAVLIAVGMLMVYARKFMNTFRSEGLLITRWLPLTSAAVITFLGLGIAVRALITGGILQVRL